MTEILFFGGVWLTLGCIAAVWMGRILGQIIADEDREEEPVVNFHERRQQLQATVKR